MADNFSLQGLTDAVTNNCFSCEPLRQIEKAFVTDLSKVLLNAGFKSFFLIFIGVGSLSIIALIVNWYLAIYRDDLNQAKEKMQKGVALLFKLSILSAMLGLIPIAFQILPLLIQSMGKLAANIHNGLSTTSGTFVGVPFSLFARYCEFSFTIPGVVTLSSNQGLSCFGLIAEKSISWGISAPAATLENFNISKIMQSFSAVILLMITIMGIFKIAGTSFKIIFNCLEITIKIISLPFILVYGNQKDAALSLFKSCLNFLLLVTFLITSLTLMTNAASYAITADIQSEVLSYKDLAFWQVLVMLSAVQAIIPACEQAAEKTTESLVSVIDKTK